MRPALAAFVLCLAPAFAEARQAQCETTDDGAYACDFRAIDRRGSFAITAPGKPSYVVLVDEPGVAQAASGFGNGRTVPLPGPYRASRTEPGCWVSDATSTRICAR